MRLLTSFTSEKDAYTFDSYLKSKGVESSYEMKSDPHSQEIVCYIWIVNEDDFEKASAFLDDFKKNPLLREKTYTPKEGNVVSIGGEGEEDEPLKGPVKMRVSPRFMMMRFRTPLTRWIVWICVVFFMIDGIQGRLQRKESPALNEYVGMTPMVYWMAYDIPLAFEMLIEFFKSYPDANPEKMEDLPQSGKDLLQKIEVTPTWSGVPHLIKDWPDSKRTLHANLFGKIKEGQLWRIWSPVLLHRNFLHILFNMLWLWLLGRQVEQKVGKGRYLLMMLIVAAITNTLQYVMSGPFFMGYSGVICGLGGFIWIRLIKAPWEGYIIQKGTLVFLGVFVLGMLVLQMVAYAIQYFNLGSFEISIANTAHISGILSGMVLAHIPFFYRLSK